MQLKKGFTIFLVLYKSHKVKINISKVILNGLFDNGFRI
jgi:hypothetical protein